MKTLSLIFLLSCQSLFAGWFDFFGWGDSKATQFECPYHCGEFGSKSIQEVEILLSEIFYGFESPRIYCPPINLKEYEFPEKSENQIYQELKRLLEPIVIWQATPVYENGKIKGLVFQRTIKENPYPPPKIQIGLCGYSDRRVPVEDFTYILIPFDSEVIRHVSKRRKTNLTEKTFHLENTHSFLTLLSLLEEDIINLCTMEFHLSDKHIRRILSIQKLERELEKASSLEERQEITRVLENSRTGAEEYWEKERERRLSSQKGYEAELVEVFFPQLAKIQAQYQAIYQNCVETHKAPIAFYNLALMHFHEGDHMRALEKLDKVLDHIDLDLLEDYQASHVSLSRGAVENQIALYDVAIQSLGHAIQRNPKNKEAYFERAISYFEQGDLNSSIEDFLQTGYQTTPINEKDPYTLEFTKGLLSGTAIHGLESAIDFIPSMVHTISGLSHGLWAFACSPVDVSRELVSACQGIATFLKENDSLEVVKNLIPEVKELSEKWHNLQPHRQGELIGTLIGKYGTDFLIIFAITKGTTLSVRGIKAFQELRHANAALTLEKLAKDATLFSAIEEQHIAWWNKTKPIIDKIKANKRFDQKLAAELKDLPLSELQVRQILHHCEIQTFPKPKGIPANCIVEISEKSGGMIYRKAGTTEAECVLVRVMPGKTNSSNPLQQKPYVVQRVGNKAITKEGTFVKPNDPKAHIPLDQFKFTEWE